MAIAKVMVNGVNMLAMPEFREVIKSYDVHDRNRIRLVGFVETRFGDPEHLDRVMHSTPYSPVGLTEAYSALMAAIAEYDRVANSAA